MRTLFLSSLLLLTACCTTKDTAVATPAPKVAADTTKPGAPSSLRADVTGQIAKLAITFAGDGEQVRVSVSGLEGVTVTSGGEWLTGAKVRAGEEQTHDVSFAATAQGQLVISVEGTFAGQPKRRVHTVQVGEGAVKKDLGTVQKTSDGDTVKLVP